MAYLIFSTEGREWDRRELTRPVVVGRSADCEISIHDILLSRRHCRFTPANGGWLLIDLGSRNGTKVGGKTIEERNLRTGDVVRIGKTKVTFRGETFVPPRARPQRPLLPPMAGRLDDTLAGTIFDLEFDEPPVPARPPKNFRQPTPKPRPKDPQSFETDDLYSMLEQIASSSWDSIYAVNAQPLRKTRLMPQPIIAGQSKLRPARPQVSMALQASPAVQSRLEVGGLQTAVLPMRPKPPSRPRVAAPIHRRFARLSRWISSVGMLRFF